MKSILFILVFLGVWGRSFAEVPDTLTIELLTPDDSLAVHFEANVLQFPAGHEQFDSLYELLRGLPSGQTRSLRVLHIGGSHVQAGIFSGKMRQNLSAFNGGKPVGRGLVFPFSMMNTNGARDIQVTCQGSWQHTRCVEKSPSHTLGLAGAALTTSDTLASIFLTLPSDVEQVTVLGSTHQNSLLYPILIEGNDTLCPPMSDELTGYDFLLSYPSRTCHIGFLGQQGGEFTLRGFLCDADGRGLIYSDSGINGASVPSWLKCDAFSDELSLLVPGLVIFAIGINDANVQPGEFDKERFRENYVQLIRCIRDVNPQCSFLFVTNNDCCLHVGRLRRPNPNTASVEEVFLDLAREYKGAVWNLYRVMGGMGSSSQWLKAGLMQKDRVHFTSRGYQMLGNLLYNALVTDYQKYCNHGLN